MLKIRLQRIGRKNDPSFRVVCTDSQKGPKSGNNVEVLGSYDPKQSNIVIKGDRVKYWISQGAQVSDTVNNILVKEGIIKAKKKHVSRGKKNTRTPEAEKVKTEEAPADLPSDSSTETSVKEEATAMEGEVKTEEVPVKDEEVAPEKEAVV